MCMDVTDKTVTGVIFLCTALLFFVLALMGFISKLPVIVIYIEEVIGAIFLTGSTICFYLNGRAHA